MNREALIIAIEENEKRIKALQCNEYGTPVDMDFANALYAIEDDLNQQLNEILN